MSKQFLDDLTHHARGAGFLTMAAGTCVLGSQVVLVTPWMEFARVLWLFGVALCLGLSYTFFAAITVSASKPKLETGISGEWLLLVVSEESISVLGTLVAPAWDSNQEVLFVSLAAHGSNRAFGA